MKLLVLIAVAVAALVALALKLTWEAPLAIVFGWTSFIARVIPRITVYWPSLAVGVTALVLFTVGLQWFAQAVRLQLATQNGIEPVPWRWRWTGTIVATVIFLFAAGVSVIGIVHQIGWLAASNESPLGKRLDHYFSRHPVEQLKQLYLGVSISEPMMKTLPSAAQSLRHGEPPRSWESQILVGLTISPKGIDWSQPWNHPANQRYYKSVIPQFINPEFRTPQLQDDEGYGVNHYAGNSQVMLEGKGLALSDIKDGQSRTILVGEVNEAFSPWGRPGNVRDPAVGINRGPTGFGGPDGRRGAYFSMVDGSVRLIHDDVDPQVLRALSTPNGGEDEASR